MKEIKRYLDTRQGAYSFYFEDLNSGYTYGLDETVQMTSASCIKVPIAIALFKEVENDKIDLNLKIMINKEDMVDGSGIIYEFDEREYSIKELLLAMLIQSDNTATNKLIDILSIDRINELISEMGLIDTSLNRKIRDVILREKGIQNSSTSLDLSNCLKLLYNKSYLNEVHSNLLIKILCRQQVRNKIPFYIPKKEWINIANKSGSLPGVENDSALFMISKGNFVFTVMSKNLPNNVYGLVTISKASKMMWDIVDKEMGNVRV